MTADNGGQLLLAVYNTITKSYIAGNRFDVKVYLYTYIVIRFYHCLPFQVLAKLEKHIRSSWYKRDTDVST